MARKFSRFFCELFPDATLFTLLHVAGVTSPRIESLPIRTAFTQKLPGVERLYRWYLPLHPWAIESLDLDGFDLVLSSSHCVAKGVQPAEGALHICYCHTPMRYVWDRFQDYFGSGLKAKLLYGPVAKKLRAWDRASASRVDHFVANSTYVAERIEKYYGRATDAVIPPPVDTDFYVTSESDGESDGQSFCLVVSALVPYKRIDLAIEAFRHRKDELVIVGSGPSAARLKATAPQNVRFLGWADDATLRELYQTCRACLLLGVEDFGIVLSRRKHAARRSSPTVKGRSRHSARWRNRRIFHEPTPEALSRAIDKVYSLGVNKKLLREWALGFSRETFQNRMREFITTRAKAAGL